MSSTPRDHAKLICDIGELSDLFVDTTTLEAFLQKIVVMISEHMDCPVCSIYIFYEDMQELVLKATHGLHASSINNVRMKLGEGLTGLALKEMRPVCERNASTNPNFRFFPGIGEERYESFLVVPILRGQTRIGAMVIQNIKKNYFMDDDIKVLRAITSQLANTIETTRLLMVLHDKERPQGPAAKKAPIKFLKGRVASLGYAYAEALVLGADIFSLPSEQRKFEKKYSLKDFKQAVQKTEKELESFQQQIEEKLSDVASLIFSAQILMLKDKAFVDAIVDLIQSGVNPPEAILQVVEHYIQIFSRMQNTYMREKYQDVKDIGRRLLENLTGRNAHEKNFEGKIIIAQELLPSDALKLSSQKVGGIILLSGGVSSHLSILARSLQIPMVIIEHKELLNLDEETKVLLDAEQGTIFVNPDAQVLANFKERDEVRRRLEFTKDQVLAQTFTKDSARVTLLSNINLLGELKAANEFKTEGVGLYRSEFPFIVRSDFPTEEEQLVIYKKLVDTMRGKEITFRTLDIGGDKVLSYYDFSKEENPFLGMRSIRFSLRHQDIFEQQIRAILRASHDADIRIMFPMISSVDELLTAKSIIKNCIHTLQEEKLECQKNPQIGIMIELPSVLEILDDLAKESDFFCIGTNDFIQYMLAVDRTNEKVADLYLPHHPSVLRALKKVVDTAISHKIDVSICGDMAHEPKYFSYFLGIGIRKFSIDSRYIPKVQEAIGKIDLKEARQVTEAMLRKSKVSEIARMLERDQKDL